MSSGMLNGALIVGAYLIGSIPFGLVFSKGCAKVDIRNYGSRNIGATNVYRNLGKKLGAMTLAADILKGFFPVWIASELVCSELAISAAALAAFCGHLYPIYLKFRGGKGVATAAGVYLVLAPLGLLFSFFIFALTIVIFRYVSLSSVTAAIAMPIFMYFSSAAYPTPYVSIAGIIAVLIAYRHKDNVRRLLGGKESKMGGGVR